MIKVVAPHIAQKVVDRAMQVREFLNDNEGYQFHFLSLFLSFSHRLMVPWVSLAILLFPTSFHGLAFSV